MFFHICYMINVNDVVFLFIIWKFFFVQAIIYRFKFLMLLTLVCAALTIASFIMSEVIESHLFIFRALIVSFFNAGIFRLVKGRYAGETTKSRRCWITVARFWLACTACGIFTRFCCWPCTPRVTRNTVTLCQVCFN